jgi:isopenicillin-N epimerase
LHQTAEREIARAKSEGINIRLAVIDSITSGTGTLMPFASLAKLFRSHNIPVFLDAAHGVGQIELNVSSLEIDYMVTNCHKWVCANKGCALMWVREANHHLVRPLVVSHSHHQGLFSEFAWCGTDEFSSFLSVIQAARFWRSFGIEEAMQRNRALTIEAANLLAKSLSTILCFSD